MEVFGMKPMRGFIGSMTVLGGAALVAGAFSLGRLYPAVPAQGMEAAAAQVPTPEAREMDHGGAGGQSFAFKPFAASSSDVFAEMSRMREEMERFAAHAFHRSGPLEQATSPLRIREEDGRYVASMPVQGLDNGSIDIEVQSGMLIVNGSHFTGDAHDRNRSESRTFRYMVSLPPEADPSTMKTACTEKEIRVSFDKY